MSKVFISEGIFNMCKDDRPITKYGGIDCLRTEWVPELARDIGGLQNTEEELMLLDNVKYDLILELPTHEGVLIDKVESISELLEIMVDLKYEMTPTTYNPFTFEPKQRWFKR